MAMASAVGSAASTTVAVRQKVRAHVRGSTSPRAPALPPSSVYAVGFAGSDLISLGFTRQELAPNLENAQERGSLARITSCWYFF
jgi:hypothetical protein